MNRERLTALLHQIAAGTASVEEALTELDETSCQDLGFAHVDHGRAARCGFPEVILGTGKTSEQIVAIARSIAEHNGAFLATRLDDAQARALLAGAPGAVHEPVARVVYLAACDAKHTGCVTVVTAGTSDIGVAEEARVTAELLGSVVRTCYDVGVAGLHRLFAHRDDIQAANAIVVAAGMEGALASVIGGLVDVPVIAVPTSVGYGASFEGVAALLGMLNSCAATVSVVNIDNGFGAGYIAGLVNRLAVGRNNTT